MKHFLLACCCIITAPLFAIDGDALLGKWQTKEKKATILVTKVGNLYEGHIIGLRPGREHILDVKNPDPKKRTRKVMGVKMLRHFHYKGDGRWKKGKIYDPVSGNIYKSSIKMEDENTISIRGYVGVPALGRSTVWKRVD